MQNFMAKEKLLTLNELTKYHKKTLIPFLKENFATKTEVEHLIDIVATKEDLKGVGKRLEGVGKRLEGVEKKLEGISTKEDVKNLSKQLTSSNEDLKENNKLETRVEYLENILNVPAIKKQ